MYTLSSLGRRDSISLFKLEGKVVGVIKATEVCNLADSTSGLVGEDILCSLKSIQGEIFVKAKARLLFEQP